VRCAGHGTAGANGSDARRQIVLCVIAALPLIVTLICELESEVRCALIDRAGGPPSGRCSTTQGGRDGREGLRKR
jgi:hypothetical protein